jgi:hypothetical protein
VSGGFCNPVGEWRGSAEVYDGHGRFLGNGVDQRSVAELGEGRVRIDLSFTGPFKFAGHYVIADRGAHRVYQGPVNIGFAEALGEHAVQADNYWPAIGMSQRFLLMVMPGGAKQLSLALLSRGERLCYAVVGEHDKQLACALDTAPDTDAVPSEGPPPSFLSGASVDLGADPAAGRGEILLHRAGRWHGSLTVTDGELRSTGDASYEERVEGTASGLRVRTVGGGFAPEPREYTLVTDGWQAWTPTGGVVGSYSLSGGRALSGVFQRTAEELRVWRREVVSHDGSVKAVIHNWYRGGVRIGTQHGVLEFEAA